MEQAGRGYRGGGGGVCRCNGEIKVLVGEMREREGRNSFADDDNIGSLLSLSLLPTRT